MMAWTVSASRSRHQAFMRRKRLACLWNKRVRETGCNMLCSFGQRCFSLAVMHAAAFVSPPALCHKKQAPAATARGP